MSDERPWFRPLYNRIVAYEGPALADEVLRPWAEGPDSGRAWLQAFAARRGAPIPAAHYEELHTLYGLSRCNDVLLGAFAPRPRIPRFWSADPSPLRTEAYVAFFESLGMRRFDARPGAYCPFWHEIVLVEQAADPDEPITVAEAFWPGLVLGPMLFSRAGVRVRGGVRHIRKGVAEDATLHFTYRRTYRDSRDLSLGWGSNSQWATSFRRDYALAGTLYYNVDARPDADRTPDPDFTAAELRELVRFRSFVVTARSSEDAWPYDTTVTERAPAGLP